MSREKQSTVFRHDPFGRVDLKWFDPKWKQEFEDLGFVVVPEVLEPVARGRITSEIVAFVNKVLFEANGEDYRIDPKSPETFNILSSPELRKKMLKNPNLNYPGGTAEEKGQTRQPIIANTNGMVDAFFLPCLQYEIYANPMLYEAYKQLSGCNRLLAVPERCGVKAGGKLVEFKNKKGYKIATPGAGAMPKHIDYHLNSISTGKDNLEDPDKIHYVHGKPSHRIQCLVSIETDATAPENKGGNLWVLPFFHHFAHLAALYLSKENGVEGLRSKFKPEANTNANFMFLKEEKNFQLETFRRFLDLYRESVHGTKPTTPASEFDVAMKNCIEKQLKTGGSLWPERYSSEDKPTPRLQWTYVNAPPGAAVFWSVGIPHYNGENLSFKSTPRIVCYVDYEHRLLENVYETPQFHKRKASIAKGEQRGNTKEREMFWGKPWESEYSGTYGHLTSERATPLMRALLGFDPNTGETYTWEQFEAEKRSESKKRLANETLVKYERLLSDPRKKVKASA